MLRPGRGTNGVTRSEVMSVTVNMHGRFAINNKIELFQRKLITMRVHALARTWLKIPSLHRDRQSGLTKEIPLEPSFSVTTMQPVVKRRMTRALENFSKARSTFAVDPRRNLARVDR